MGGGCGRPAPRQLLDQHMKVTCRFATSRDVTSAQTRTRDAWFMPARLHRGVAPRVTSFYSGLWPLVCIHVGIGYKYSTR